MYSISLDVANPNGKGPINPPTAISTLVFSLLGPMKGETTIRKMPINIKIIPVSKSLSSIFV